MLQNWSKYLFWGLVLVFIVTFFTRNDVRSVTEVDPEVLRQPIQIQVYNAEIIHFVKDGYEYFLTPVYEYDISGLVVGKMDYRFFSIDKMDSTFPFDVCLIWGSNVLRGLHTDRRVKFSEDCRWCWAYWSGDVNFNLNELSNNHLLIDNNDVLKQLRSVCRGDQLRIRGKLVNVKAKLAGKAGPPDITWNTSTSRTDSGAGACEVFYVEKLEVLNKANVVSRILFQFSAYALILWVAWKVISFFRGVKV